MQRAPLVAIIDDDDGVRTALASLVRSLGYDLRSYVSPPEFLRDAQMGDPDCMIADIQMPAMTGDRLQAELIAEGRIFPMIFMTAFPTAAIRDRVMAAGACCFLEKPADTEALAGWLAHAIEGAR